MKVKIISADFAIKCDNSKTAGQGAAKKLEKHINDWIEQNPKISIIDIQYNSNSYFGYDNTAFCEKSVLINYNTID